LRIEDVEIHVGDIDRPYRILGAVKATERAPTIFNNAPNVDGVHSKLREQAAGKGGNAVINVTYRRGIGLVSWKELTANGTAVVADAALPLPAPVSNLAEQLQQLGDLHQRGVLTDVEFQSLKTNLLARV
jgi:hypothetical protein